MENTALFNVTTRVVFLPLLFLAVGTPLCLPTFSWRDDARGRATVEVSEPEQDLGHTTIRKVWDVAFQIRNTGSHRLILNKLDNDCCSGSSGRTIIVPPQESTSVTVALDTRFASGLTEASLSLTTNSPECPVVNLVARVCVDATTALEGSKADP